MTADLAVRVRVKLKCDPLAVKLGVSGWNGAAPTDRKQSERLGELGESVREGRELPGELSLNEVGMSED